MIHKPYLHSNTASDNDTPAPLVYDSNNDLSIVGVHSRSHPSAASGSSSDNNDSHTFYENSNSNSNSNTPTASASSVPSTPSPSEHSAHPEYNSPDQLRKFACSFCEVTFRRPCDLKYVQLPAPQPTCKVNMNSSDHINRKHIKRYKCVTNGCSQAFHLRGDLKRHIKTHQEQEPFHCQVPGCQKSFTRKDNLQRHNKTHSYKNSC